MFKVQCFILASYYDNNPNGDLWIAIDDQLLEKRPLIDMDIADKAIETLKKVSHTAADAQKPFFVAAGDCTSRL